METLFLSGDRSPDLSRLPVGAGVYYFSDGNRILFAGMSNQLKQRVEWLLNTENQHPSVIALISTSTHVSYEAKSRLIDSLVWLKRVLRDQYPPYNKELRFTDSYAYLALQPEKAPYIFIADDTQGNALYAGPFRNRFFLHDVVATMHQILHLPICLSKEDPCDAPQEKECQTYCQDQKPVQDLLLQSYLQPAYYLIQALDKKRQSLFDELQFSEAELLATQIQLLSQYDSYLSFLYVARDLQATIQVAGVDYRIERGLLASLTQDDRTEYFMLPDEINYRPEEMLAVNKTELDEMWILYLFLQEYNPVLLRSLYEEKAKSILTQLKNYNKENRSPN